ncbi:MAG: RNA 2',3'-cyclic phosphodiesterase [Verrucomicrobia bacterium]|nr:RNA 2',3'-cyclic phosphodiesterase [Verrucomicrobiota bacterium]
MPEPPQNIRAFLAVPLPPEVLARLKVLQRELGESIEDVAWTRPESVHLTIRFFGNVPHARLAALQQTIRQVCAEVAPCQLRAEKTGCFGGRVIWVGLAGDLKHLEALAAHISDATRGFGDHNEQRAFRPHLTIGRVKPRHAKSAFLAEKLSTWANREFGGWAMAHLELMRSELSPQGARYSCLDRIPLEGKGIGER